MDRGVDMPWLGFGIPWVGGRYTMGMEFDIPCIQDIPSIYMIYVCKQDIPSIYVIYVCKQDIPSIYVIYVC